MKIIEKSREINENQRGIRENHRKSQKIWKESPGRLESSPLISIRPLRIFQKCHSETLKTSPESYFFFILGKKIRKLFTTISDLLFSPPTRDVWAT